MYNNYSYRTPSNIARRAGKKRLDSIRRRLDSIRKEQSDIYTHFTNKYKNRQFEDIITDQQMNRLKQEVRSTNSIAASLAQIEASTGRRLTW